MITTQPPEAYGRNVEYFTVGSLFKARRDMVSFYRDGNYTVTPIKSQTTMVLLVAPYWRYAKELGSGYWFADFLAVRPANGGEFAVINFNFRSNPYLDIDVRTRRFWVRKL